MEKQFLLLCGKHLLIVRQATVISIFSAQEQKAIVMKLMSWPKTHDNLEIFPCVFR